MIWSLKIKSTQKKLTVPGGRYKHRREPSRPLRAFFTVPALVTLIPVDASIVVKTFWMDQGGMTGSTLQSATKAAVQSLTRTFAAELLTQGVRENAFIPSTTATPFYAKPGITAEDLLAFAAQLTQRDPLKRFGEADEVPASAVFRDSDKWRYMLSAELVVDGGFSQP